MIPNDKYCLLSSCCKLVRGIKRCVIIDYDRSQLFFISHEYLTLLERLDRKKICDVEKEIDKESKSSFRDFLSKMLDHEIIFFTENPDSFPKISEEDSIDNYIILRNIIIEIDSNLFKEELFNHLCKDLRDLRCEDVQIRFLSEISFEMLNKIVEIVDKTTYTNYLEIHCAFASELNKRLIHQFIERYGIVNNLYIYGSHIFEKIEIINNISNHRPIPLGNAYFIPYPFDSGNCCGIITQETLGYSNFYLHNQLKTRNGCLDRKITIDKFGNIKNCPSMKAQYGNIKDVSIKDILQKEEFQKYWFINKDQIDICKVCEFRYNCTDCRAFLQNPDDIYSKPLKCGYNPYTAKWEDWSTHPLKQK